MRALIIVVETVAAKWCRNMDCVYSVRLFHNSHFVYDDY